MWKISTHCPSMFWFHHIPHTVWFPRLLLTSTSSQHDGRENGRSPIEELHVPWLELVHITLARVPLTQLLTHMAKTNHKGGREM